MALLNGLLGWLRLGGKTAKGTQHWGSEGVIVSPLHGTITKEQKEAFIGEETTQEKIVVINGRAIRKVTGNKKASKGTQVNPKDYGVAVCGSCLSWVSRQEPLPEAEPSKDC